MDEDCDYFERKTTRVLGELQATQYIESNDYIRNELAKRGIFDIEAYKNKQAELRRKKQEEYRIEQEKRERELYEQLKAKYEKNSESN